MPVNKASSQVTIHDVTDGYAVNLSTDSYTFAGGTAAVSSTQSFSTVITALQGSGAVGVAVDTADISLPTGLSVAKSAGTNSVTLTFTATTSLTNAILNTFGHAISIPVVVNDDVTITKSVNISIALTGSTPAAPYSIIMGNEAQSIPCDKDGDTLAAGSITIPFSIYQGTTRRAATVTVADLPSGITVDSNTAGTASAEGTLVLSVAAGSSLGGSASGEITLTFKYGSTTVGTKKFSWSKSITGATGAQGDAGTNAQWYSGTGITGTSTTATIFSGSGVANAHVGDMYLNTSTQNTYRCTVAGAASVAKWVYVSNIKGATGTSSTNVVCGNEAVSIPCTLGGLVKAASTITIPFAGYTGTSRAACTVAYSTLPSGITVGSNTAATTSADGSLVLSVAANGTLGGASVMTGEITLTFTCNGQTFTKKFTWSKAMTGATGAKGDAGDDAIMMVIISSAGTVFKNNTGSTVLTVHVYVGGAEVTGDDLAALGTIQWYKNGTALSGSTGTTLTVGASDVDGVASYEAVLSA